MIHFLTVPRVICLRFQVWNRVEKTVKSGWAKTVKKKSSKNFESAWELLSKVSHSQKNSKLYIHPLGFFFTSALQQNIIMHLLKKVLMRDNCKKKIIYIRNSYYFSDEEHFDF